MPDPVEVVVPLRTNGCPHREAAFQFCRERYTYPLTVAPGGEPWIKAAALWPAVQASSAEILVIADADVVCDGIPEAVRAVRDGAAWARPHNSVVRLSQEGTEAYMAGVRWQDCGLDQRPYHGIDGGGVVVTWREVMLEIPPDARFLGWGQEDSSWGFALYSLLGPCWKGSEPLVHLYHPPAARLNRKKGSHEGWALMRRYAKARHRPDEMRALLKEARESFAAHQPPMHPDPAAV